MNLLDGYKANTNGNPNLILYPPLIAVVPGAAHTREAVGIAALRFVVKLCHLCKGEVCWERRLCRERSICMLGQRVFCSTGGAGTL